MKHLTNLLFAVENGIGIIKFNRPHVLNALNVEVLQELSGLLDWLKEAAEVQVIILTGKGDKAFVAGADIPVMQPMNVQQGKEFAYLGQELLHKIEEYEKPIIAAINGFALGGGTEISMACDIRIASDKARFGQPEVKLGIIPGFGGTQRLPRLVGRGMAKLLIFTGQIIDAQEALEIGLVEKVVPHETLMSEAKAIAATICAVSPTAVRLAKAAINHGMDVDMKTGNRFEAFVFGHCFATEDQIEGMTAFIEKRQPLFPNCYSKKQKDNLE